MRRSAILKSRPGEGGDAAPLPVAPKRERPDVTLGVAANSVPNEATGEPSAVNDTALNASASAGGAQLARLPQAKPLLSARPLSTSAGNVGAAVAAKPFAKPGLPAKAGASADLDASQQTIVKKRKLLNISYKKGATSDGKKPAAERASPVAAAADATQPERYFLAMCVPHCVRTVHAIVADCAAG